MTPDAGGDGLPYGLPRLLMEDSNRLNDLLGLNRKDRRFMASIAPADMRADLDAFLRGRAEPPEPGERDRLLIQWHYSHPEWRRLDSSLNEAKERVRSAYEEAAEREQQVLEKRRERPPLVGRRQWTASLAELQAAERAAEIALGDAQLALLTAISPFGKSFEPPDESVAADRPAAPPPDEGAAATATSPTTEAE